MFKILKNINCRGVLVAATLPFSNNFDKVEVGNEVIDEKSDGWQRVKKMYQVNEFDEVSDEVTVITQTALMSGLFGLVYGGIVSSRNAFNDFMRQNTAATFTSHYEAKRKLQDAVTISFAKGAWKWCWRLCVFTTSFVGISTTLSVYRGETGILEYGIAGIMTGSLYKWQMGPRGMLVGGALGGVLGLVSGTATYGLLQLSGVSMSDLRKCQSSLGNFRKEWIREGLRLKEEEDDPILKVIREKKEASEDPNYGKL